MVSPLKIQGYAIMDALVNFPAYKGRVDFDQVAVIDMKMSENDMFR